MGVVTDPWPFVGAAYGITAAVLLVYIYSLWARGRPEGS
jgi:hypothetical protein